MSAAAPWSVKGIDPKAREIAKDLARRSGMTLGEWLNSMIMDEPDEDDGVTPLPRRSPIPDPYDRRARSRRLDDAYASEEEILRTGPSLEVIAERLEAVERRSTAAIQDIEQAVAGMVQRLEGHDRVDSDYGRRIEDMADELRQGHKRLRLVEQAVVGRPDTDILAQVSRRLDDAQVQTSTALKALEQSFATLDQRLRSAEGRVEPEGSREVSRFERLAETLTRQVEGNRTEMMRRLDVVEIESRADRLERTLATVSDQSRAAEQRSAAAVEAMGREVLRIAQNLNSRVAKVEENGQFEVLGKALSDKLDRDLDRHAQTVEQRMTRSDDQHALALERLGGEITRISDRLSERIAQSERRSAQALEDIGRRLAENNDKIDQRYERTSGDLAERMRQSEERTARLLSEARESIEQRSARPARRDVPMANPEPAPWSPAETTSGDWRAAAFSEPSEIWSDDSLGGLLDAAPFPTAARHETVPVFADPLVNELNAYAAAREQETPPAAPFGSSPERAQFGSVWTEPASDEPQTSFADHSFNAEHDPGTRDEAVDVAAPVQEIDGLPPLDQEPDEDDGFSGESDFIDPAALRAGAAAGRASTRDTLDAARAAIAGSEEAPRLGFGLKAKGGKSKLQERLDKQATREGSTTRKAISASAVAALVIGGGYAFTQVAQGNGADQSAAATPEMRASDSGASGPLLAAVALKTTPTEAVPSTDIAATEGASLFARAVQLLDKGDDSGLEALKRAADLGHAGAQMRLAGLYQEGGAGLEPDAAEARNWARRAAEGGEARAMHYYAMQLYDGVGGPQNRAAALGWLKRAAETGRVDSQYNVARLYEKGDAGVVPNQTEAFKWYMIAARRGDQQALAAVQRLTPVTPAATRKVAREAADAFTVDPVA